MTTQIAPGEVLLGKYRVERVLGQGGMGVVVAARHLELGQLHAIKFLLPAMLEHQEIVERFLREARAAAKLQSDHVVRVSDVGRMESGAPYMVMEYLEGCDLKVLVSREGPLRINDVVTYVLQVCDAISEAHSAGIIHRDLKPANLFLVRRRGGLPCVKVLDFGISKHTGPEEVDLTNTNMSLGSPMYMSPEQMSKSKATDGRADIWAIGVILYELLTGDSPFRASSLLEVAFKVLQEEPKPLSELRRDLPPGLVDVVMRCLRKRREDRFPDVEALMEALRGFASPEVSARLPLPSFTNELEKSSMVASGEVDQVEAQTIRVEKSAPTLQSPSGEPTAITFGQTGKPKLARKTPLRLSMALGVVSGVVSVVGWLAWNATTVADPAPAASTVAPDGSRAESAKGVTPDTTPTVQAPKKELEQPEPPRIEPVLKEKPEPVVTATPEPTVIQESPKPKAVVKVVKAPSLPEQRPVKPSSTNNIPDNPF